MECRVWGLGLRDITPKNGNGNWDDVGVYKIITDTIVLDSLYDYAIGYHK